MKLFSVLTLALAAGLSLAHTFATQPATAQEHVNRPNLMVVVQEDDPDTTPARRQRIMSRVVGGMSEYLHVKGYNVYDQTAITQDFVLPTDRRKARAALIDIARTVKEPPLDAVLLVKLYASAEKSPYNNIYKLRLRTEADFLDVRSGQFIGHFETEDFNRPVLPVNCDRDCILEEVGRHAKVIGNDLARAMEAKLAGFLRSAGVTPPSVAAKSGGDVTVTVTTMPPATRPTKVIRGSKPSCQGFPTAYTLTFVDFNNREQRIIEEFLNSFSCLQNIRMLPSSPSRFAFWYETTAKNTTLNRNLRTMLEYMSINGHVSMTGSKIVVKKVLSR